MKKTSWIFVVNGIAIAIMFFNTWYAEAFSKYNNCTISSIGIDNAKKYDFQNNITYSPAEYEAILTTELSNRNMNSESLPFASISKNEYNNDVNRYLRTSELLDQPIGNPLNADGSSMDYIDTYQDKKAGVDDLENEDSLLSEDRLNEIKKAYPEVERQIAEKLKSDPELRRLIEEINNSNTGLSTRYIDENGEEQIGYTRDIRNFSNPFDIQHEHPMFVGEDFDSESIMETNGSMDDYSHHIQSSDNDISIINIFVVIVIVCLVVIVLFMVFKYEPTDKTNYDEIKKGDMI